MKELEVVNTVTSPKRVQLQVLCVLFTTIREHAVSTSHAEVTLGRNAQAVGVSLSSTGMVSSKPAGFPPIE